MPLAHTLRPKSLDEFVGQEHLVGENKPLRIALERGHIFSMIFWGPPGVGKTTLARIIANQQERDIIEISAVSSGKKDLMEIVKSTKQQKQLGESYAAPLLFIDEIHRFNKAQQDYLLPYVEDGTLILIGATTENPSFEVISALLSRTKVFTLKPLNEENLKIIINSALAHFRSLKKGVRVNQVSQEWLVNFSAGDARKLLNLMEQTFELYGDLSLDHLKATLQTSSINYDKAGDEHYDTISAFIKSMRASNADAALYYLARMVHAGEDPKFIARRMVIFASEDIGLAAPTALVVANAVFDAVHKIGYPEAQINLAHGAAYLCKCKKNRSAYDAYFNALADVDQYGNLPIPLSIRNAPTDLMKELGYGKNYNPYPPANVSLLPNKIKNKKYLKEKS